MNTRIGYIDSLKGVGIILVMMRHMCSCKYLTPFYGGFIPLFFIASGLTSKSIEVTNDTLRLKAKRLLLPYVFYSLTIVSLFSLFALDRDLLQNIMGILYARCRILKDSVVDLNIGLLPREIAPLWFLPAMFVAYVSIFVCKIRGGQIAMCIITIIASMFPIIWPWSFDTAFVHGLFVLVGYRYKDYFKSISFKKVVLILPVYLLLFYFNKMPNISISAYGIRGIFSIPCYFLLGIIETMVILYFCKVTDKYKISSVFRYLGRNSLRLMCIHMGVFTYYDEYSKFPNSIKIVFTLIIVFILTYFIEFLVVHFGNKNILLKSI